MATAVQHKAIGAPQLPDTGFVRLPTILSVFPVSKSTWWAGVKSGRYPLPVKLSPRTTAWPVESIRALIEQATASGKPQQPLAAS